MSVWPSLNHQASRGLQKAEAVFFLVSEAVIHPQDLIMQQIIPGVVHTCTDWGGHGMLKHGGDGGVGDWNQSLYFCIPLGPHWGGVHRAYTLLLVKCRYHAD